MSFFPLCSTYTMSPLDRPRSFLKCKYGITGTMLAVTSDYHVPLYGNTRASRGSDVTHAAPQIQLICFSMSLDEIFVPPYQIFLKDNFQQYLVPSPFASTGMLAFPWQQQIKTYHHQRHHQTVDCKSSFSFCIVLGNP